MNLSGSVTVKDTKGKYVFWDVDGVLAPFRFDDCVWFTHESVLNKDLFRLREPSRFMQKVVRFDESKKDIVLGHCRADKEIDDKNVWLDNFYPSITERIFIPDTWSKADIILDYCKKYHINLDDVIFIDDTHSIIQEAEQRGIKSYHISSFMDFFLD